MRLRYAGDDNGNDNNDEAVILLQFELFDGKMRNRLANDWQNGSYPNMDGQQIHTSCIPQMLPAIACQSHNHKINVHFKSPATTAKMPHQARKTKKRNTFICAAF